MIYFYEGSRFITISSVDFDGVVPSDISLLLAYDHRSYKRVSNLIGSPLNGVSLNSKRVSLSGKVGFQWYGGSTINIKHLKASASLSLITSIFIGTPLSIYSDIVRVSKVTMGDFK